MPLSKIALLMIPLAIACNGEDKESSSSDGWGDGSGGSWAGGTLSPPRAEFVGVDLVDRPTARELARWGCFEYLGDTACGTVAGLNKVSKSNLLFSFDLVFDLSNPNQGVPVSLTEILLATTFLDDENLGALCVSFCHPDSACEAETNAEGACEATHAGEYKNASDIVPTVDELMELASYAPSGEFDNDDFRTIPPDDTIETHIQFDFNIDTTLGLMEYILIDLAEDIISGRNLSVTLPYSMDGTLFFNIPSMGRHAIGFGPVEDKWKF